MGMLPSILQSTAVPTEEKDPAKQTADTATVIPLGEDGKGRAALTVGHRNQNSGPQSLAGQTLLDRWFQQLGCSGLAVNLQWWPHPPWAWPKADRRAKVMPPASLFHAQGGVATITSLLQNLYN